MQPLALLLGLLPLASTLPTSAPTPSSPPLPLIIWHGLGDRYDADGIASIAKLAQKVHPGTYVYPIRLSDDGSQDSRSSFFSNVTASLDTVCSTLTNDTLLNANVTRIDALGFSQGGQFLRALVEKCPGVQVRSLVTFGSQHNGIAQFQKCGTFDLVCKAAVAAVAGNAWSDWVQGNIVPAQYYREINESTGLGSDDYIHGSHFLADVNNEKEIKNGGYAKRIAELERFVMYVFEEDTTVIPKESGWFAEVNATSLEVTPLRERKMYKEDWLGLKRLDEKNGLVFRNASGGHMDLTKEVLTEAFSEFYGPEREEWKRLDEEQEVLTMVEL